MLYDPKNCKRVKESFNHITWVHTVLSRKPQVSNQKSDLTQNSRLRTQDFTIRQCFFGEHLLLLEPNKTVAITESEKTAIIASVYYPNYIWIATGSLEGLSVDKCQVLKNRRVILFPDVNGYAKWHNKARELNLKIPTATFTVDNYLERTATPGERLRGVDIADRWIDEFLLQLEIETFNQ